MLVKIENKGLVKLLSARNFSVEELGEIYDFYENIGYEVSLIKWRDIL